MEFEKLIRDVVDFPKPGIVFKDITPLLADGKALGEVVKKMAEPYRNSNVSKVIGIEARGFIFAPMIAQELGIGFIPVRKPGKLPSEVLSVSYELEYGTDTLEIHKDAISAGENILIVDDLIATGGTIDAVIKMVNELGGNVAGVSCLIELGFLNGKEKFAPIDVHALLVVND